MNKLTVIIPAILLSGNVFAYCAYDDFDCKNREAEQARQQRQIDQQQIEMDQMKRDQNRQEQEREREYNRWQIEQGEQDKYRIGSDQNTNSVICHYLDPDC